MGVQLGFGLGLELGESPERLVSLGLRVGVRVKGRTEMEGAHEFAEGLGFLFVDKTRARFLLLWRRG